MMLSSISLITLAAGACVARPAANAAGRNTTSDPVSGLPIVDLSYTIHRALTLDKTTDYYNFSNIRYAAPPIGNLRFRKPVLPETDRATIEDGALGRVCPGAYPAWQATASSWIPFYLLTNMFKRRDTKVAVSDGRSTEDCLFLDVIVPYNIFHGSVVAPVLIWIYGGGFAAGDKTDYHGGSPAGIIKKSGDGVVFVTLNYRAGAFGFMGGSDLQQNGDANAGLWDQRLALQWVQDHIAEFGGDPNQVTVMGESAGGGSIMHHITAFGGNDKPLFQQAIPQSPGFLPQSNLQANQALSTFLTLAGVTNLDEARKLSSEQLIAANEKQITNAPYGTFVHGPTIDGGLVPRLPALTMAAPGFRTDVRLLLGHNTNEGIVFVNKNARNGPSTYLPNLAISLPSLKAEDANYLSTIMYPPADGDTTLPYKDEVMRQATTSADVGLSCNTYALAAFTTNSYVYEYGVFPGIHTSDIPDTFFYSTSNNVAADALQQWIASFVVSGRPSSTIGPVFPTYGASQNILKLTATGKAPVTARDDISIERCKIWFDRLFPDL